MNMSLQSTAAATPSARGGWDLPDISEYLAFRIATQEYGVDLLDVQEIRRYEKPTCMTSDNRHLRGVLDLRGTIVPILDLRSLIGGEACLDALTVTIVLNLPTGTVGLVVDAVSDVVGLTKDQIQSVPNFNDCTDGRLMTGLGKVGEHDQQRLVVLLDSAQLLKHVFVPSVK